MRRVAPCRPLRWQPRGDHLHCHVRPQRVAVRAHDDCDELKSGAGLGLSIARWIAVAHGGTPALERSSPGGSLFVLTLPSEGPGELVYPAVR